MYFIYRGVRYTPSSLNLEKFLTPTSFSQDSEDWLSSSIPPMIRLQHQELDAAQGYENSTPSYLDPELEAFINAFWDIINA